MSPKTRPRKRLHIQGRLTLYALERRLLRSCKYVAARNVCVINTCISIQLMGPGSCWAVVQTETSEKFTTKMTQIMGTGARLLGPSALKECRFCQHIIRQSIYYHERAQIPYPDIDLWFGTRP